MNTMIKKALPITAILLVAAMNSPLMALSSMPINIFQNGHDADIQRITSQAPDLKPAVLNKALLAYDHARQQGMDKKGILTVVDYTLPSVQKRLWVIDLNSDTVEEHTLVAHGKGSGLNYAKRFTNQPGSDASCVGVFLTGDVYNGDHPNSMRLQGLEKGFNNNAYRRTIVMHPAWYVSESFAKQHGYLGRSWGCLALDKKVEPKVVNTIKNGTIVFSYYPDQKWLSHSAYLKPMYDNSNSISA